MGEQSQAVTVPQDRLTAFRMRAGLRSLREEPHILVVEDQFFSNRLLSSLFQRLYTTYTAISAAQALEVYIEKAPDIVFLDIELPDMNGHDLATMICGFDNKAYIVMVTANNSTSDVQRARAAGARGFIIKPYSKRKILESVQKFLDERK